MTITSKFILNAEIFYRNLPSSIHSASNFVQFCQTGSDLVQLCQILFNFVPFCHFVRFCQTLSISVKFCPCLSNFVFVSDYVKFCIFARLCQTLSNFVNLHVLSNFVPQFTVSLPAGSLNPKFQHFSTRKNQISITSKSSIRWKVENYLVVNFQKSASFCEQKNFWGLEKLSILISFCRREIKFLIKTLRS